MTDDTQAPLPPPSVGETIMRILRTAGDRIVVVLVGGVVLLTGAIFFLAPTRFPVGANRFQRLMATLDEPALLLLAVLVVVPLLMTTLFVCLMVDGYFGVRDGWEKLFRRGGDLLVQAVGYFFAVPLVIFWFLGWIPAVMAPFVALWSIFVGGVGSAFLQGDAVGGGIFLLDLATTVAAPIFGFVFFALIGVSGTRIFERLGLVPLILLRTPPLVLVFLAGLGTLAFVLMGALVQIIGIDTAALLDLQAPSEIKTGPIPAILLMVTPLALSWAVYALVATAVILDRHRPSRDRVTASLQRRNLLP